MTNLGLLIIFVAYGGATLLGAIIPGLVFGIPIGMLLRRRSDRFLASLAASLIVAAAFCVWRSVSSSNRFDHTLFIVLSVALLIMTYFGSWLGRKLEAASPPKR